MRAAQFRVEGMHCPTCPVLIEDAIKQVAGVKDARAYRQLHLASVLYDEGFVDTETIRRRIQDSGFVVTIH